MTSLPSHRRRGGRATTGVLTASLLAVAITGCGPLRHLINQQQTAAGVAGGIVATGRGWTSGGLQGPIPAPGSCHYRLAADGEPLPDPKCTPGAVDTAVTNTTIKTTICRRGGYTGSVRPPASLTEPVKKRLMAAYGIPWSQASHYELDHLIDLASGGSSDVRNLWPEPNTLRLYKASAYVHNDKDQVETYVFHATCGGKTTVAAVQNAVAGDWTTAAEALHLPATPAGNQG